MGFFPQIEAERGLPFRVFSSNIFRMSFSLSRVFFLLKRFTFRVFSSNIFRMSFFSVKSFFPVARIRGVPFCLLEEGNVV